ncbi:uncharacterized protein CTHT_0043030 [Thermochaetoides thermophila DSM 1495]|uniref:Uncharacterized protein n=1 Tax=Chaetomium thermophilum (strain DSM 1495 / CBS 144.50 / IMI 039719) TaxID=759272 RepID=G0SAP6_CHATD|nr:hypothetical protein CTHT_0043030 [Thermochaetoides thermophila DSM 1495]EGS19818.1 hypothetical protein CTHT_0043030 [Thermochaetoides thermophila DSM 1495]
MADNVSVPVSDLNPTEGKPVCGSGDEVGEYDLGLHVAALFLVMAASVLGAGFPVVAKKVSWVKVPTKVFFVCKHFGTGVLIATAFVHLLPTAFGNLTDPCLPDLFTDQYPAMPGVIMMASMFCLFVLEMWLNDKLGGHSHGGPTGYEQSSTPAITVTAPSGLISPPQPANPNPPPRPPRYTAATDFETDYYDDVEYEKKMAQRAYDEKMYEVRREYLYDSDKDIEIRSDMPAWFVVFYEQYVRQKLDMMNTIRTLEKKLSEQAYSRRRTMIGNPGPIAMTTAPPPPPPPPAPAVVDSPYIDVETGQPVDPQVYKRMSMNITLLEGGILFHSVFVGMTISITIDGFIVLLIAMLFHQAFEGLGLGSRIAAVPYPRGSIKPWLLVLAFGTTCPIGQAIGLIARDAYDPNSAFGLIIVGVFNAISSGLLLYAALVDLLAEDFLSEEARHTLTKKDRTLAFICVLLGAAGMSVVGAFA